MKILFVLKRHPFWGLIPEAIACNVNKQGQLALQYRSINNKNKANYTEYCNNTQLNLLNYCLQLDDTMLASKFAIKKKTTPEEIFQTLISDSDYAPQKEYIMSYINNILNKFYKDLNGEILYLPSGKTASLWQGVYSEENIPEVYYQFNYSPDRIVYTLSIDHKGRKIDLNGAQLLSRKPARILWQNSILSFPEEIDGAKMIPFFNKEEVVIPKNKVNEYLEKIIAPLIKTGRVISEGFTIEEIECEPEAILQVTEYKKSGQLDIFGNTNNEDIDESMIFKLIFKYTSFVFEAGFSSPTVKMNREAGNVSFLFVSRKPEEENEYIHTLKSAGLKPSIKLPKTKALEWINFNYDLLQEKGIELQIKQQTEKSKKYFIGKSEMFIKLDEQKDWFDVLGSAVFGPYKVALLTIIDLIRKNKNEIRLPNGEYALIPQAWIDEYKGMFMFVEKQKGIPTLKRHFAAVVDELNRSGYIAMNISETMRKFLNAENIDYDQPLMFNGNLRPYQVAGYNWLRSLDDLALGGCLADDMGLGKTIQTLCLLQWMKEQNKGTSLLVVPTSLIYNWQLEAAKFAPDLKVYLHTGPDRTEDEESFLNYDLIICSYAILRNDINVITRFYFNYAILDEAQAIKNPESGIAQACYSIKAERYLSLTGTPIENSITDLWSQMNFSNQYMLGNKQWFYKEFIKDDSEENRKRLNTIVRPFILRRLKKNVLNDLPEKIISIQYCDMHPSQLDAYRLIKNEIQSDILNNLRNVEKNKIFVLEGLLRMRQAVNHPILNDPSYTGGSGKFDLVCNYIDQAIEEGNKVLVFSSFVKHLELYRDYLESKQIKYCYIDGASTDRQKQVEYFQEDDSFPVFLLSIKAGGAGLNLTRASYVFLLDPWWNPAVEAQAFDRAHRIGQKNTVFVYKFITRDSVEEKILKLQESKLKLSEELLTSEEGFLKSLDKEGIEELLR